MKYFLSVEKGYATARHYIIGVLKKGLCDGLFPKSQLTYSVSQQILKVFCISFETLYIYFILASEWTSLFYDEE
jgi:hypothetical protein